MDSVQQQIDDLRRQLEKAQARIDTLEHFTVAPESGGGSLTVSGGNAILRLTALTPSGVQMP